MAVAAEKQRVEMLLAAMTANRVLNLWGRVDPRSIRPSWAEVAPALYTIVTAAQGETARSADPYLVGVAAAQEAVTLAETPVNPRGFAGVASDGRSLEGALLTGPLTALAAIGAGAAVEDAMDAGRNALRVMVLTQVADAARASVNVSMFLHDPDELPEGVQRGPRGRLYAQDGNGRQRPYFRPKSYVRMVQPGACSRCIILAGVRYKRAQAFLRHPDCHCAHIPVDENLADVPETDPKEYFDSLSPAQQDKAFTKAGAEAIRAGADMNQVVNARRGMTYAGTSSDGTHRGQKLASPFTSEGVTKRGLFGVTQTEFKKTSESRYTRAVQRRLTPEEIFRRAPNREEAIRLLKQNAFIF